MGQTRDVEQVKLFCGIIAVNEDIVAQAKAALRKEIGVIDRESGVVPFNFTDYYRVEMGDGLLRQFVSFEQLIDPSRLVEMKLLTNEVEKSNSSAVDGDLRRRMNLDPGYVTPAKVVLATTKDFSHRIYLGDGIYAEVTMVFRKSGFGYFDWTYPDFRSGQYDEFLLGARKMMMGAVSRR